MVDLNQNKRSASAHGKRHEEDIKFFENNTLNHRKEKLSPGVENLTFFVAFESSFHASLTLDVGAFIRLNNELFYHAHKSYIRVA